MTRLWNKISIKVATNPLNPAQTREEGSIVIFTVMFSIVLLALLGLAIDGGRAMAAKESAIDEAEQAARAGANILSRSALYSGQVRENPIGAIIAAEMYMRKSGHPGIAGVYGRTVVASITPYRIPTTFLSIIGINTFTISASSSATSVAGP